MITHTLRTFVLAAPLALVGVGCMVDAVDEERPGTINGPPGMPGLLCAPPKVGICHVPPGNPANAHAICVGAPAEKAHVKHGDHVITAEACDGLDNDCDGQVDEGCCVDILLHCDGASPVLETLCGPGNHVLQPNTAANISYVVFGSSVQHVTLNHCQPSPLSSLVLDADTNLCDLQGGCCDAVRWNDQVCSVDID